MDQTTYTAVRIRRIDHARLKKLAAMSHRSMVQQLAWLIEQAWEQQMNQQAEQSLSCAERDDSA